MLTIALKDLRRTFRSPFMIAFILVLPLLQAGLPYLAFSHLQNNFDLPQTSLQIVNLDRPVAQTEGTAVGSVLVDFLKSETLSDLLKVQTAGDPDAARAAVIDRRAEVALIIPADFSAALFDSSRTVTLTLIHDPALQLGPAVVQQAVENVTTGFSGALIAADVTEARRGPLDAIDRREAMTRYGLWSNQLGESLARGDHPAIRQRRPAGSPPSNLMASMIGPLLLGMMVFFSFMVGALGAQSLLKEREAGTLARLLTTPITPGEILGGKVLALLLTLTAQVALLAVLGSALFQIRWGTTPSLLLAGLALVVAAAGLGLLIISFLKHSRQAFLIAGGVVLVTSIAGGTMSTTFADLPAGFKLLTLFTPQGWVLQSWEAAMRNAPIGQVLFPAAVAVLIGIACFVVGNHRIKGMER